MQLFVPFFKTVNYSLLLSMTRMMRYASLHSARLDSASYVLFRHGDCSYATHPFCVVLLMSHRKSDVLFVSLLFFIE